MPTIRNWQLTPPAARRQCLIHTNPRSAACAISRARDYHPNVWSNSSSGIGIDTRIVHQPIMPGFRSQIFRLVKLKFRDCLKHRYRSSQLLRNLHLQRR